MICEVGGHRFGVPLADVVQLLRAVAIVPLPRAPRVVEGIIDLHGSLVPVLDLRRRFGLPEQSLAPEHHLIVTRTGERRLALRVDRAEGFRRLEPGVT